MMESRNPGQTSTSHAPLSVVVLGSGGPVAFGRASTSYLVLIEGIAKILVDAGAGAFARLGESQINVSKLDTILLTHLHIDHAAEAPSIPKTGVIVRRAEGEIHFQVFGPEGGGNFPGTFEFIHQLFGERGAFAYLRTFGGVALRINTTDLAIDLSSTPREIFSRHGVLVQAVATHHGDAPSIAYRVDYRGVSAIFSGDVDASGLSNLSHLIDGTDLLVMYCGVLVHQGVKEPGVNRRALP